MSDQGSYTVEQLVNARRAKAVKAMKIAAARHVCLQKAARVAKARLASLAIAHRKAIAIQAARQAQS